MANESTKVVTGKVRLSYVNLITPTPASDDRPDVLKYSVTILVPKSDKATIAAIRGAQKAAMEKGKDTKFKGRLLRDNEWRDTFRDADDEPDTLEKNPDYAGHYFMRVACGEDRRPKVVDAQLNPIIDPDEIYSGMYARVSMNAYPYNTNGNKGISFGLNNVQKVADGERMGGGSSRPEDDFEAIEDNDDLGL